MNKHSNGSENNTVPQSDHDRVGTISLFSRGIDDAMCVLRILGPADSLGLKVVRGVEDGSFRDRVEKGDLVVIQRDFSRELDAYEKVIGLAHASHKPVVLDLDDLLFELPADHPDRLSNYYTDSLLPMLQAIMEADLVTVATPALRDYLLRFNKNIKVFPNYLIDDWWSLREPPNNELAGELITIGYMGGHTHKPDLWFILPALESILRKYQPKIRFQFWGIEAPPELTAYSQVDWCPPKSYAYHEFASYFQTQSADIMIAPLVDTLFNRCKSSIKYLEYSSLGAPGVYSRMIPYESVVENGVNGFLASSQTEWEQSLSKLIEDPTLRNEIAINAQKKIRKNWLLSPNASKLKKIYEEAVSDYPGKPHQLPPFYLTVKSFARQIYEGNQRINQQIDLLEHQIGQLKEQNTQLTAYVNQCEDELVDYSLSTSWQVTRPLRKITGKLKGIR